MLKTTKQIEDFRIKGFQILNKCLKACQLFIIQKAIRQLQQDREKGDLTEEKEEKQVKFIQKMKDFSARDVKITTVFLLVTQFEYDLDQKKDFFKREAGIQEVEAETGKFELELENPDSQFNLFFTQIQQMKKYKEVYFQMSELNDLVTQQKMKSQMIQEKQKENFKMKKYNQIHKSELKAEKAGQQEEEEQKSFFEANENDFDSAEFNENYTQPKLHEQFGNQINKERHHKFLTEQEKTQIFQEKKVADKPQQIPYSHKKGVDIVQQIIQQQNVDQKFDHNRANATGERTEFRQNRRDRMQRDNDGFPSKQNQYKKPFENQFRSNSLMPNKTPVLVPPPQTQIHPSWKASIERKETQKKAIYQFSGVKQKLC